MKNAEERTAPAKDRRSAIRGSLLGGAIGDALGYPIEFLREPEIRRRYGPGGLEDYAPCRTGARGRISDDTQMTLYTAEGLQNGLASGGGGMRALVDGVAEAYLNWYDCQVGRAPRSGSRSPLSALPAMRSLRAPGNTCMGALGSGRLGAPESPCNDSRGCGGVMRVAPVALFAPEAEIRDLAELGARAAALTHGHPLGWLSAAALVWIVHRAAFGGCPYADGLYGISRECREALPALCPEAGPARRMAELMARAEALARGGGDDASNIRALGEGWTGEEALAIALYCCLRHPDDLSRCLIAAVNHGGDSDSTGAVAGNILGAWLGAGAIEPRWLGELELRETILETADALFARGGEIHGGIAR